MSTLSWGRLPFHENNYSLVNGQMYNPATPPEPAERHTTKDDMMQRKPYAYPKGKTYHKSQDDGCLPLLAKQLAENIRQVENTHDSKAGAIFDKPLFVHHAMPSKPGSQCPKRPELEQHQPEAMPKKQEGETSFVNYADASKSYDAARETVGCDLILGAMAMSPMNKPLGEQHLFDSGCGTGNYVASLMDKVGHITMSDFSEGMLEKARAKFSFNPKVKNIDQADSCNLPYPDESFDAVMSNQVIQHIETDETRPTRANLRTSCKEAYRVLKPGGTFVISTRSKEPSYDHLYWYAILAPKAVAAMSERVPSRQECVDCLLDTGFTIGQTVTPKYAMVMNKEHYYDPKGVFSEAWRRGESWWSLVSNEELLSLQNKVAEMIEAGTVERFIKERDELRCKSGQTLFIVGYKPLHQK
jgi:ubiquinone/menaquinone biosynthesis C-methylase UbiE